MCTYLWVIVIPLIYIYYLHIIIKLLYNFIIFVVTLYLNVPFYVLTEFHHDVFLILFKITLRLDIIKQHFFVIS